MLRDHNRESRNIVLLNKGEPFIGTQGTPLVFVRHATKKITGVIYRTSGCGAILTGGAILLWGGASAQVPTSAAEKLPHLKVKPPQDGFQMAAA